MIAMKMHNLKTHISTGEDGNSFVGIKINGNDIEFYYPESYHFDKDNYEREDILDLLKTISIAKSNSIGNTEKIFNIHKSNNRFVLMSYIWIIEDYLENGIYTNFEKNFRTNQRGRVNWKRTFNQQPMISGQDIVYKYIITEVKNSEDNILVEIHRYCIWKSLSLIGWLFDISPECIEHQNFLEELKPMYLNAIRRELDQTFDDRKRMRLQCMEDVLDGLGEIKKNDELIYGVDSYYYIFERMIDSIFGNVPQEKIKDYYPIVEWNLKFSDKNLSSSSLRPDTILSTDNEIYIIDSKFYRYGSIDLSKTYGLPSTSSIQKQITYGNYIKEKYNKNKVYNAFIIPYDCNSKNGNLLENKPFVYIGYASANWHTGDEYSKIYTFLIDLKYVIKTWCCSNHKQDKKNLIREINKNNQ